MTEVLHIDIVKIEILDLNAFTDDPEDNTEPPLVSKNTDAKLDDKLLEMHYEFIKGFDFHLIFTRALNAIVH